jgi:Fe2+ transport system protein FeoA
MPHNSETIMSTLDTLKPGQQGVIATLNGDGAVHQRLHEMGVIDGADVEVVRVAPLGDPIEIRVQGYHLSLRKSEAALVQLEA